MNIIFSNYDLFDDLEEQKIEFATCNDMLVEEVSDDMMIDILNEVSRDAWDSVTTLIDNACTNNVLCYGGIGRWDGSRTGWSVGPFDKVLYNIIEDCDYVELSIDNESGDLVVRASHHDGTNYATIKNLTNEGYDFYDDWSYIDTDINLDERQMLEKLLNEYSSTIQLSF